MDDQTQSGATGEATAQPEVTAYPGPPVYDFLTSPQGLTAVGASQLGQSEVKYNLWRSARWSPDASCILTATEDRTIRLYHCSQEGQLAAEPISIPCPDAIVSTQWYPFAAAAAPEGYCFAASIRGAPVRLIDAYTGKTRATYPIVDHRERFIAPHSMAFNPSGTRLYAGHENAIEILDLSRPGYDNAERFKTTATRNDKSGQRGIISALAFATDQSGSFAAGTFDGSVSLYEEDTPGATGHLEGVKGGGVTQIAFHPLSPTVLFVASRRSTKLQAFDTRNPSAPIIEYDRPATTNQRLSFDIDPWGRYLAAGCDAGTVKIFDIGASESAEPVFSQRLHGDDAVSSVQLHPYRPLLLTAAGSRIAPTPNTAWANDDSDDSSSGSDSNDGTSSGGSSVTSDEVLASGESTSAMQPVDHQPAGKRPCLAVAADRSQTTGHVRSHDAQLCIWSMSAVQPAA